MSSGTALAVVPDAMPRSARRSSWLAIMLLGCQPVATYSVRPEVYARPTMTPASSVQLLLVGDAGGALPNPVLDLIARQPVHDSLRRVVLYLGDNVYPAGVPPKDSRNRAEAERRLFAQITASRSAGAQSIFVPGNHDYGSRRDGRERRLQEQATFVREVGDSLAVLRPSDGCAGPDVIDVDPLVRVVVLNTEWFLRPPKDRFETGHCLTSEQVIMDSLARVIDNARGPYVIVAGHHPLRSAGPHGGFRPFNGVRQWIRQSPQDLNAPRYAAFRSRLDSTLALHPPFAYVSGHEHNLQVYDEGRYLTLVSGAASADHASGVAPDHSALFAVAATGFMRLDFSPTRRPQLSVVTVHSNHAQYEPFWLVRGRRCAGCSDLVVR